MNDWFWIPCAILGGVCAVGDLTFFPAMIRVFHAGMFANLGYIALFIALHLLEQRE